MKQANHGSFDLIPHADRLRCRQQLHLVVLAREVVPTATAIPKSPHPVSGATLGGKESSLQGIYGDPSFNESDIRHYNATINGTDDLILVSIQDGIDGPRAVFLHLVTPYQETIWSKTTSDAIAKKFIPPDAKFVKTRDVQDYGTERLYCSSSLAAPFSASAFIDNDTEAPVTPSTFYYACGNQGEPEGGCTINLGQ